MIDTPQIVQTTEQQTAFIHLTVTPEEMQKVFGPTIGELMAGLAAQGIAPAGPVFAHHRRRPTDTFDFELSVPVSRPVTASGRVQPGAWPAMRVARTIHHGPYEGLPEAWGKFMEWIAVNGLAITEDIWECYLTNPDENPDPATWRTELNQPLIG
jgi:effector-binding domain-containing protein